jgi:hypothetical protein
VGVTEEDCLELQEWTKLHRDELIANAEAGHVLAQNIIKFHRMLVRKSDWPTWAMFASMVYRYKDGARK